MLLRGVDRQIGLTERINAALVDTRHASYITHSQRHFPDTLILVRGDGHFSAPEMVQMITDMPNMEFIFGFSSNVKLHALAEATKQRANALSASVQTQDVVAESVRLFDEFPYAARSWPKPWRVLLKAEVMAQGENPRFIVTSLEGLDACTLYEPACHRLISHG